MMLQLLQQPADIPGGGDVFTYHLALKLGKTVGELDLMPYQEYVNWASFFTAKHAIENQRSHS